MKLKDGLILREVAGQFVVVPTGKRVQEVTSIVYISSSGAYLWDYMKDHEFQKEDLVKKILEHYTGVTGEQAAVDIEKFLKTLADNNILDDGKIRGAGFCKNAERNRERWGMSLNRPVAEWNGWILSTRQSGKKPLWMLFRFPEPLN